MIIKRGKSIMYGLELRNIYKNLGNLQISNLNLYIYPNELFGIIGPKDSGKTSLLRLISGLFAPDLGFIFVRGKNIKGNELKKNIGFSVEQDAFYPELSVQENLDFFGKIYGMSGKKLKQNSEFYLKLCNLEIFKAKKASGLSKEAQKMLDICCSIIHDPNIIVLDEPFYGLSRSGKKRIQLLIQKLQQLKKTIIVTSDDISDVEHICQRVAIMRKASLLIQGTPEQLRWFYAKNEEIRLETYPGSYNLIVKELIRKGVPISNWKIKEHQLIIYSKKAETLVHHVMHILEDHNERLIELEIRKPSLTEAFQ